MVNVAVSGDSVWGVNKDQDVYCANGPDLMSGAGGWAEVPGKLVQVSVSGNDVWGVNNEQQIFYSPNNTAGDWMLVCLPPPPPQGTRGGPPGTRGSPHGTRGGPPGTRGGP